MPPKKDDKKDKNKSVLDRQAERLKAEQEVLKSEVEGWGLKYECAGYKLNNFKQYYSVALKDKESVVKEKVASPEFKSMFCFCGPKKEGSEEDEDEDVRGPYKINTAHRGTLVRNRFNDWMNENFPGATTQTFRLVLLPSDMEPFEGWRRPKEDNNDKSCILQRIAHHPESTSWNRTLRRLEGPISRALEESAVADRRRVARAW